MNNERRFYTLKILGWMFIRQHHRKGSLLYQRLLQINKTKILRQNLGVLHIHNNTSTLTAYQPKFHHFVLILESSDLSSNFIYLSIQGTQGSWDPSHSLAHRPFPHSVLGTSHLTPFLNPCDTPTVSFVTF